MKLSETDRHVLRRAARLKSLDMSICPHGAGQWARFRKLVRLGLLAFGEVCAHEETGEEAMGFDITTAGEAIVA